MERMIRFLRFVLVVSMGICLGKVAYGQSLQDDTLRANYLIRFIDFVHWERPLNQPVMIGVVGSRSVYSETLRVVEEKRQKGRDFAVVEIGPEHSLEGIDLVYVARGQRAHWPALLERAKRQSVVTVCDDSGFLDAGGLIEFTVQKNRLRFALNLEEAEAYRLGLSSKLVQLAVR